MVAPTDSQLGLDYVLCKDRVKDLLKEDNFNLTFSIQILPNQP